MLSEMLADSFVWDAINSHIRNTRRGSNGSMMINCTMCVERGETPDTRHRCGIKREPDGVMIHCWNCAFKAAFHSGETISPKMKKFLNSIGVGQKDIQRLSFKALQYRRMIGGNEAAQSIVQISHSPNFLEISLPDNAYTLKQWIDNGIDDKDFSDVISYLYSRGNTVATAIDYFWSPTQDYNFNRRFIIPFYHNKKIIGFSGRLVDKATSAKPKYWTNVPSNFIFNNEKLDMDRKFIIIAEGPLDALAVEGCSPLGGNISPEQAMWLNTSNKTKIVLPDRDKSGQRLIDHALTHGWMVSFPKLADGHGFKNWWDADIKDAAQATERYGKLYTIRSIIESATSNKIEIGVKRKRLS